MPPNGGSTAVQMYSSKVLFMAFEIFVNAFKYRFSFGEPTMVLWNPGNKIRNVGISEEVWHISLHIGIFPFILAYFPSYWHIPHWYMHFIYLFTKQSDNDQNRTKSETKFL